MDRLWLLIILLCHQHGEVDGLNQVSEMLGCGYCKTWNRLRELEKRDRHLTVYRYGKGKKIKVFYRFDDDAPHPVTLPIQRSGKRGGITFLPEMLYSVKHGPG